VIPEPAPVRLGHEIERNADSCDLGQLRNVHN
jgi:hypothetical protein